MIFKSISTISRKQCSQRLKFKSYVSVFKEDALLITKYRFTLLVNVLHHILRDYYCNNIFESVHTMLYDRLIGQGVSMSNYCL